jgi:hypothetical protein
LDFVLLRTRHLYYNNHTYPILHTSYPFLVLFVSSFSWCFVHWALLKNVHCSDTFLAYLCIDNLGILN